MMEHLELTKKVHNEERAVIKKLVDMIKNLDTDNIQDKDIINIRSEIKQTARELKGLENFGHMLFYIDDDYWTDEERINRAKHMA